MQHTTKSTILFIMMACAVAASTAAADPGGEFQGETTVNVVEVPVKVVDESTGDPITGLTAADFVIRENGAVQEIANFAEIATTRIADTSASEAKPVRRPLEIVYFFDLFLAKKSEKQRALNGLREHYRSSVRAGENVSVVAFDGNLEVLLDRSDDNFDVLDSLDEIDDIRTRGLEQSLGFSEALIPETSTGARDQNFYERRQRSNEYFHELEKRVTRVGEALSATMARFANVDGRRVVVAFTPGFPDSNWAPTYSPVDFVYASARYPVPDLWRDAALEAADLGFTLYIVDSSGLQSPTMGDAEIGVNAQIREAFERGDILSGSISEQRDEVGGNDPGVEATEAESAPNPLGSWMERTRKNLLVKSAESTGGSAVFDYDIATAVTRVAEGLDHYYSLAYQAQHIGDGHEYSIEVELPRHDDVVITHRTSYIDLPTATRQAQRLRSAMLFGGDANPLGIRVETGEVSSRFRLGAAGTKRVQVPFTLRIPFARIEMIDHGETHEGELLITFFGEDSEGNQSELAAFEQPISLPSNDHEDAVSRGFFSYTATIEIEGGEQKIFVGVRDTISGRTSIMPQHFDF